MCNLILSSLVGDAESSEVGFGEIQSLYDLQRNLGKQVRSERSKGRSLPPHDE